MKTKSVPFFLFVITLWASIAPVSFGQVITVHVNPQAKVNQQIPAAGIWFSDSAIVAQSYDIDITPRTELRVAFRTEGNAHNPAGDFFGTGASSLLPSFTGSEELQIFIYRADGRPLLPGDIGRMLIGVVSDLNIKLSIANNIGMPIHNSSLSEASKGVLADGEGADIISSDGKGGTLTGLMTSVRIKSIAPFERARVPFDSFFVSVAVEASKQGLKNGLSNNLFSTCVAANLRISLFQGYQLAFNRPNKSSGNVAYTSSGTSGAGAGQVTGFTWEGKQLWSERMESGIRRVYAFIEGNGGPGSLQSVVEDNRRAALDVNNTFEAFFYRGDGVPIRRIVADSYRLQQKSATMIGSQLNSYNWLGGAPILDSTGLAYGGGFKTDVPSGGYIFAETKASGSVRGMSASWSIGSLIRNRAGWSSWWDYTAIPSQEFLLLSGVSGTLPRRYANETISVRFMYTGDPRASNPAAAP